MDNAMEQYEKQCMCLLFNKADTTLSIFTIKSPLKLHLSDCTIF